MQRSAGVLVVVTFLALQFPGSDRSSLQVLDDDAQRALAFSSLKDELTPVFEFRSVVAEDGSDAAFLRFEPQTGETWLLSNSQWSRIEPTGSGDGLYDVLTVATAHSWKAIRVDRASGNASILKEKSTWVTVEEPVPLPP